MQTVTSERIFYIINYLVLALLGITCLLPLLHIVALSLSDRYEIMSGRVLFWPIGWSLESFDALINGTRIVSAFKNSVVITIGGVALSMLFTIMAAYPLSRSYFFGRRFLTLAIVFTMLFSGGMIPTYLVVKGLGLINSYGALWFPALVSAYNMLIMKNFFENIPEELQEAARIDGCSESRLIRSIILPLSMPVIATLSLFYGVSFWNAFMNVLIYITETSKYNLAVLVQQMVQSQTLLKEISGMDVDHVVVTPEGLKAAGIVVMVLPMLVVYPFLQKYFVKGVMLGSIKG
jgi:putative aldouronate transport system permease protein